MFPRDFTTREKENNANSFLSPPNFKKFYFQKFFDNMGICHTCIKVQVR